MVSSLNQHSSSSYSVRDVIEHQLSHYTDSPDKKKRLAEKVILAAAENPDLFVAPDCEAPLVRLVHQIAQEEFDNKETS